MKTLSKTLIVVDAGPLIALAVADVLLQAIASFSRLLIPASVIDECLASAEHPRAQRIKSALENPNVVIVENDKIGPLDSAHAIGLGTGEIAVISYALQHNHVALIDDDRARRVALKVGVQTVRTGAILILLKNSQIISSIKPALLAWQVHGYFLSDEVRLELLNRANEQD